MLNFYPVKRTTGTKKKESTFTRLVRRSLPTHVYDPGVRTGTRYAFSKINKKERRQMWKPHGI